MTTITPTLATDGALVMDQRISWGSVFAGLFLAVTAYLFLGLLGTAIGTSAIEAIGDRNPLAGFGTGAGVWVAVSTLAALAIGAYVAGRTAPNRGLLHGVLCWAATTLAAVYALSSMAGGVIGTATHIAGSGLSIAGQGVAAVAPNIAAGVGDQLKKNGIDFDFDGARQQLEQLLRQTGKSELSPEALKSKAADAAQDGRSTASQAATAPQGSGDELAAFFDRLRQRLQPELNAADKDALVNIVMARTGRSRAEAEQVAANYAQTYSQAVTKYNDLKVQAERKAREMADAAARGVSRAAWAAVIVMLLGLAVSAFAGAVGFRSRVEQAFA